MQSIDKVEKELRQVRRIALEDHDWMLKTNTEYTRIYSDVLEHVIKALKQGDFSPFVYLPDFGDKANAYKLPIIAALTQFGDVETINNDVCIRLYYDRRMENEEYSKE
jgi:hypothetical protein